MFPAAGSNYVDIDVDGLFPHASENQRFQLLEVTASIHPFIDMTI
jgi:hypothetical protein